jgi:PhoPQ-activated pathogenicity-related protein
MPAPPRISAALLLVPLLVLVSLPVFAQSSGLELTALDRYVHAPDPNYRYQVVSTVSGDGYTTFIVEMTSQQWLTEAEVNLPLWEHVMTITRPDTVVSDIGFMFVTGGSKTSAMRTQAPAGDVERALQSNTVVSTLYMVPNQPLVFADDDGRQRTEDSTIAYTWDKYLRTGDEKWPLRLPMTKSVVRAMDTVTDLLASAAGGEIEVDQFVVAGGSKRGWTTWTVGAVDNRVIAIAPIVIDLLNVVESFKHHYSAYGRYADAVGDYNREGIMAWIGTPEFDSLMHLVDPYSYRSRLNLPKYILNSTGDQFFLPDSWQFYWDDLVGEKHLRYVPNSDHGMDETDATESLNAWYHAVVHNFSMPRYSWGVSEDGTITVLSLDKPSQVLLWQAHNPAMRNFMQGRIGRAYTSTELTEVEPGRYTVKLDPPATGYTAYYVEMVYPSGAAVPFKFSTGVKVVPDTYEYEWKMTDEASRAR